MSVVSLLFASGSSNVANLQQSTLTVGYENYYDSGTDTYYESYGYNIYPFSGGGTLGELSPSTASFLGNSAIDGLYWDEKSAAIFFIVHQSHTNSGWTTLDIPGYATLNRTDATYHDYTISTYWYWSSVTSSPFSYPANVTITWA